MGSAERGGSRASFKSGTKGAREILRSLKSPRVLSLFAIVAISISSSEILSCVPAFLIKNFWACWFLALAIHATEAGAS